MWLIAGVPVFEEGTIEWLVDDQGIVPLGEAIHEGGRDIAWPGPDGNARHLLPGSGSP